MTKTFFMQAAIDLAKIGERRGEVPIGAVIVKDNKVIVEFHNLVEAFCDPTAHAEMLALRKACEIVGSPRLEGCDMYVTLEPCPMCAQAISFARIRRLYFGAYDPKGGGVEHGPRIFNQPSCHHKPEVYGGISERECGDMLKAFFQLKR